MKKLFKKSLAVIMAVAMMICAIPFTASAAIYSGTCGDNLTWALDTETGVLEIDGEGEMYDYEYSGNMRSPWYDYRSYIKTVEFGEGVTSIGNYAFAYTGITGDLVVPPNIKNIGMNAFRVSGIEKVSVNSERISFGAFAECTDLMDITIGDNVKYIEDAAFLLCYRVLSIKIGKGLSEIVYYLEPNRHGPDGGSFGGCYSATFNVDPENESFYTDNSGAFIDKANGVLIQYPSLASIIDVELFKQTGSAIDSLKDPATIVPIDYTIPDTVKSIAPFAFYGYGNIKSIKFPDTVTHIGACAFTFIAGPNYLTEIILPSGVTKIGQVAFLIPNLNFIHIPSSVTEIVEEIVSPSAYICSDTEDCYAKTYAEENGIEFVLCDGNHHVCEYIDTVTKQPTCTEPGVKTFTCECGNSYTEEIPAGHTPGEWEIMTEATVEHEGHKVKKCTVCQQIVEGVNIPRLVEIRDNESKIRAEIPGDMYNGNSVELSVEEAENDAAFEFVNKLNGRYMAYDIKILVNGEVTQPTGKVTVRVPIEGFVFGKYAVYHIDPVTHEREELPCKREGNYIVFETDSFSYFVIADATEYEIQINQPSVTTINYGDTLILHADLGETALPEGYSILWTAEGTGVNINPSEDGLTCGVTSMQKGDVTVKATVVDENGEAITDANGNEISASQQLKSNVTFWQKIVSFFKNLFRISRIILQAN